MEAILVITHLPDRDSALALARQLVEARLAACVNVGAECVSVYRWQGKIDTANEVPLFIKTQASLYLPVEAAIKAAHPYELPEIVAVSIGNGLPAYLQWLADETGG